MSAGSSIAALKVCTEKAVRQLGLPLPLADCLLAYLELLMMWNRVHRLVGDRSAERILVRHILDSLMVAPWVRGSRCLDIGTGAGFPGLVLALTQPDVHWVLLDSRLKPTRFLLQAVRELNMDNVEVVRARAESYHPPMPFHTITARALCSLTDFCSLAEALCAPQGILLALKGKRVGAELKPLETAGIRFQVHALPAQVAGAAQLVKIPGWSLRRDAGSVPKAG